MHLRIKFNTEDVTVRENNREKVELEGRTRKKSNKIERSG